MSFAAQNSGLTLTGQLALEHIDRQISDLRRLVREERAMLLLADHPMQIVGSLSLIERWESRIKEWDSMRDNLIQFGPER